MLLFDIIELKLASLCLRNDLSFLLFLLVDVKTLNLFLNVSNEELFSSSGDCLGKFTVYWFFFIFCFKNSNSSSFLLKYSLILSSLLVASFFTFCLNVVGIQGFFLVGGFSSKVRFSTILFSIVFLKDLADLSDLIFSLLWFIFDHSSSKSSKSVTFSVLFLLLFLISKFSNSSGRFSFSLLKFLEYLLKKSEFSLSSLRWNLYVFKSLS